MIREDAAQATRTAAPFRLVVTGETDDKSVVVSDQKVNPITVRAVPGAKFYRLWGSDTTV